MIERFKKYLKKYVYYLPLLLMGLVFLLIMFKVGIAYGSDDSKYLMIARAGDFNPLSFVHSRYLTWSARVPTDFFTISFLHFKLRYWRVCNTIIYLLFCFSIYKLSTNQQAKLNSKQKTTLVLLSSVIIFGIYKSTFSNSVQWITGSFNYFWPMTLGLFTLIPYFKTLSGQKTSNGLYLLCFISAFYASYSEQVSVLILIFAFATYCLAKKGLFNNKLKWLTAWVFLNSLILFLAPANRIRYGAEVMYWYPEFGSLSVFSKLLQGSAYLLNHLYLYLTPLLIVICCLSCLLVWRRTKRLSLRLLAIIPLIVFILRYFLPADLFLPAITSALGYRVLVNKAVTVLLILVPTFALLLFNLWFSFKPSKQRIITSLFYILSILLALAVCFSPTIFGSGTRIFFVSEVLLGLVLVSLTAELIREKLDKKAIILAALPLGFFLIFCLLHVLEYLKSFNLRYF